MLTNLVHSTTGAIHLAAALVAMLSGAIVLLMPKGTKNHKRISYVYVMAMLMLNVTAFMIYNLFGKFGPFHATAIFSTITILSGIIPVLFRRYVSAWRYFHYYFMTWSVVGLYAAFWAETFVRLFPAKQFWPVVVVTSSLTVLIGGYLINRNKSKFLPTN